MRLRAVLVLLVVGAAGLGGCSEDREPVTAPPEPAVPPAPPFSLHVAGWNYAAFVWRWRPDSLPEPRLVQVRVRPDSTAPISWDDEPGADVLLPRPAPESTYVLVLGLEPETEYAATLRIMRDDSSFSAPSPWVALRTRPVPELTPLVRIEGGSFVMGSDASDRDVLPSEMPETVQEVGTFLVEAHEVTNAQYWRFMVEGGYERREFWTAEGWAWKEAHQIHAPSGWASGTHRIGLLWPDHPVAGVSWYEAMAYARWAGRRLPTEAEWEKAARGGCDLQGQAGCDGADERDFPWGVAPAANRFNFLGSGDPYEPGTTPVGFYDGQVRDGYATGEGASPYGVYDLSGNVAEWTASLWAPYPYDPDDGREDLEAAGPRVLRGGSWASQPLECRVAYRTYLDPHGRSQFVGFRCAADPGGP
jgi:iron(II)-dependent oxidoreductase